MTAFVARTCTELPTAEQRKTLPPESLPQPKPLSDFRGEPAYVLLGDPGMGKTTAFEQECEELRDLGERAIPIDARDFLTFCPEKRRELHGKMLFIDGLDEVRAGVVDARTPLDAIRRHLDDLGCPRFRISCREADWLGDNDHRRLAEVAPEGKITTLRLDPLTDDGVERVLGHALGIGDPSAFIEEAQQRGVDGLLNNPQTLHLLAKAVVGQGDWPENRLGTFEMACRQMATEHNEEHSLGSKPLPPARLLEAAGHLCAAQLLTGTAGHSLKHDEEDPRFIPLGESDYGDHGTLEQALGTRLFEAVREGAERRFTPVHRHVAEFLGARYLADRIGDGLSARRVLALMGGPDDVVVTGLRGLSGWLAAQSEDARGLLIGRDPVGVALYGDVSHFPTDEKVRLLAALGNLEALTPLLRDAWREAGIAFEALLSHDMEPAIRYLLTERSRDRQHTVLIQFVLAQLSRQRRPLANLVPLLFDIAGDETRAPHIRSSALSSFLHVSAGGDGYKDELKELLDTVRDRVVTDPDREMLGTLLAHLYPGEIPPSRIWAFLTERRSRLIGSHWLFWHKLLLERSSDRDVAELLDHIGERRRELLPALGSHLAESLPARLLKRGLDTYGDDIAVTCLYRWLSAAAPPFEQFPRLDPNNAYLQAVRNWLEERPDIQKAVLLEGLNRIPDDDNFSVQVWDLWRAMHGSRMPPDFGLWALDNAIELAPSCLRAAKHLFGESFRAFKEKRNAEGLTLDILHERVRQHPALEEELSALLEGADGCEAGTQHETPERKRAREERAKEREEQIAYIHDNAEALRENRASIGLLDPLGQAYFFYESAGRWSITPVDQTSEPVDRVSALVGSDPSLVEAVLAGLRESPWRSDVPTSDEIIRLTKDSMRHRLDFAYCAALELLHEDGPDRFERLSLDQVRTGLAFYFCSVHVYKTAPAWFAIWIERFPDTVADMAGQCALAAISLGKGYWPVLNAIWQLDEHPELRHQCALGLLGKFPVRAKLDRLQALDSLIWTALANPDRAALLDLIDHKLSPSKMLMAQRVRWLAAGTIASPETFAARLAEFGRGDERRVRALAEFLEYGSRLRSIAAPLPFPEEERHAPALGALISLLGNSFAPQDDFGGGTVYSGTPLLVRELIGQLASLPGDDALAELKALAAAPELARWRNQLEPALDNQRIVHRDTAFRHPTLKQFHRTLKEGEPANVADLAALVHDRLVTIRAEMRATNTDDWRLYWKEDRPEPSETPKHEESCRDVLLFQLRPHLPSGVDAQPEGQHAGDKRSDIRVAHEVGIVPVEIKKNAHQTLWSALRSQLIEQYASDADASGYGIYVVLWFGAGFTQPPPSGKKPQTPAELERRLRDTLTPDEARKIEVVVLDVSPVSSHQSVAAAA